MKRGRWVFLALVVGLGCYAAPAVASQCNDGIDNDGDGKIDWDGGASKNNGVPIAPPDEGCSGPNDDDEHVGMGVVPPNSTDITVSTDSKTCSCNEASYANGGNATTISGSGLFISNKKYTGYTTITATNTSFNCVLFDGSDVDIEGAGNTFTCTRFANGYFYGARVYAPNTTIQDSLVHDVGTNLVCTGPGTPRSYCTGVRTGTGVGDGVCINAANGAGGGLTLRRTEMTHCRVGLMASPGAGTTDTVSDNYIHDLTVQGQNHVECMANDAAPGGKGTVNFFRNRCLMVPDIAGGGAGWSGVLLQYNATQATGTAAWNVHDNFFGNTSNPMSAIPYTVTADSQDTTDCPGPINWYNNIMSRGSSGFFNVQQTGKANCGFCANGATSVYGNTDLAGNAITGPGGNCGGQTPPAAPVLLP